MIQALGSQRRAGRAVDICGAEDDLHAAQSKAKQVQRQATDEEDRASHAEARVRSLQACHVFARPAMTVQAAVRDLEDQLDREKRAHNATKRGAAS